MYSKTPCRGQNFVLKEMNLGIEKLRNEELIICTYHLHIKLTLWDFTFLQWGVWCITALWDVVLLKQTDIWEVCTSSIITATEAVHISETSIYFNRTTWQCSPQACNLQYSCGLCGHQHGYSSFLRWSMSKESLGGMMWQEKTEKRATLFTTNSTWTDLGANPHLHGERSLTNHLSHSMAFSHSLLMSSCISNTTTENTEQ
jgi:hypothetical protein